MQKTLLALIAAAGLGLVSVSGAIGAPTGGLSLETLDQSTDVIQVRQGCGRGQHREAGHCVRGCGEGWHYSHRSRHCVIGPRQERDGGGN